MSLRRDLWEPAIAFCALPPNIAAAPDIRAVDPAAAVAEFLKNFRLPSLFLSFIESPMDDDSLGNAPDQTR